MAPTVLVVEDEPDLILMVRITLEHAGYEVLEAMTGEEALAILEDNSPDAVLLDIRLPGIDGWEVLERLRGAGRLDDLPVFMCSAHTGSITADKAVEAGCRGFITKPFSPDDLIATLERALPSATDPQP